MLDVRVYRTAFLPALVALLVAAFALEDRPAPARSSLPTDPFRGTRALATLDDMAQAFPSRPAGSRGDDGLAAYLAANLNTPLERRGRPIYQIRTTTTDARTAAGRGPIETVVATRIGLSSRRIVVLAHRDATGRPARADLSATAVLLELGRVFKTRDLRKTLVLVSTSGGTTGFAGARAWARAEAGGPVDGVIVLGDMGGAAVRKPWVVGWPQGTGPVPLALQRTVQAAVRTQTGSNPGGPRALGQWMRRALPVTVSEQGPVGAEGLPAVLVSATGERGPAPGEPIRAARLQQLGRAVLRTVDAIDAAGRDEEPAFPHETSGIVTLGNVLPDWAIRILVLTLLLPALLAALDAFFRARRRRVALRPGARWLAVAALPLPVAWLWLRALGATGALPAPDGPVLPEDFAVHTSGILALASAALVAGLVCFAAWVLTRGVARARPDRPGRETLGVLGGLPVAAGVLVSGLTLIAWVLNPFAAALLIPAAHLWLFAAAAWRGRAAALALLAGLVLPIVAVAYYELALALNPFELAWGAVLGAAAGAGLGSAALLAGLLAACAGVLRVLADRRGEPEEEAGAPIRTRGPLSYAGPGSLGGTKSALRR